MQLTFNQPIILLISISIGILSIGDGIKRSMQLGEISPTNSFTLTDKHTCKLKRNFVA